MTSKKDLKSRLTLRNLLIVQSRWRQAPLVRTLRISSTSQQRSGQPEYRATPSQFSPSSPLSFSLPLSWPLSWRYQLQNFRKQAQPLSLLTQLGVLVCHSFRASLIFSLFTNIRSDDNCGVGHAICHIGLICQPSPPPVQSNHAYPLKGFRKSLHLLYASC